MLDIKFIRENQDAVQNACNVKGVKIKVSDVLGLYEDLVRARSEIEGLRRERKILSRQFQENTAKEVLTEAAAKSREISGKISNLGNTEEKLAQSYKDAMLRLPNIPYAGAPIGVNETGNVVTETCGQRPTFSFLPRDHIQLLEMNNWVNFSSASQTSGSRSYILKGDMVTLEQSLLLWAVNRLRKEGFEALTLPVLVKEQCLINTGHFPNGREDVYALPKDNLYLSGTAEIGITTMHSGELLNEADLPKLYVGISPCFRREAGSAGKDVRGLLRVHQFNKAEQYVICKNDAEESFAWHERLLNHAKNLLHALELPFRVIECCTGDMGLGKVRMHDIETWIPSQNTYRETHSCSTLHDWQARRANLKYRKGSGETEFVHTLNNTLLATPRFLIPFLENHQQKDGSIYLPEVLRPYFDGARSIGGETKAFRPKKRPEESGEEFILK